MRRGACLVLMGPVRRGGGLCSRLRRGSDSFFCFGQPACRAAGRAERHEAGSIAHIQSGGGALDTRCLFFDSDVKDHQRA